MRRKLYKYVNKSLLVQFLNLIITTKKKTVKDKVHFLTKDPEGDGFPAVRGLPPGAQPQLQRLWRGRLTAAHGAHHALGQPLSS